MKNEPKDTNDLTAKEKAEYESWLNELEGNKNENQPQTDGYCDSDNNLSDILVDRYNSCRNTQNRVRKWRRL